MSGWIAWAGLSLLGRAEPGITAVEDGQDGQDGQDVPGELAELPQGKGLGGLALDRQDVADLELVVEILGPPTQEAPAEDAERPGWADGMSRLILRSTRAGKVVPFHWSFEAGPMAGREGESAGEEVLGELRPGWYLLSLRGPGDAHAPRLLQLHPDKESAVRVDWTHTGRARGRVFGPQGEPVAGARVSIGSVEAKTDTDGRFELIGLWPGLGLPLLIEAEGLASRVEPIGVIASSEPPAELRFVLEEGAEVEGLVEMPSGQWKDTRLFVLPGRSTGRSQDGRGYAHLPLFWKGRFSDLRLDEQGRFRIRGLSRTMPLSLGLVHPRYRLASPVSLPVLERVGQAQARVLIQPERMQILSGKVLAADGKPVQAQLEMRGKGRWGDAYFRGGVRPPLQGSVAAMGSSRTSSDEQGRYSMGVPGKGATLRVDAPGFSPLQESAPAQGSLDLQLHPVESERGHSSFALRVLFPCEVTEAGKVRAIRLRGSFKGKKLKPRDLLDPREPYELRFAEPCRLRLSVRKRGVGRLLFEEPSSFAVFGV